MPDKLIERLHAARRRMRLAQAGVGAAQAVIALVALVAAFFLIDFFITSRIFPSGRADFLARLVLLAGAAGAWLYVLYTALWRVLSKRYSDDDMAMLVERRHPELRGRLISTVQLGRREAGPERYKGSAQMIAALDEQTRALAAHLDFSDIINLTLLQRAAAGALVLFVLAGGLALWRRHYAAALFQRMALLPVSYPTATRIIGYTHGGSLVAGQPLAIRVWLNPNRYVPRVVHLLIKPATGRAYRLALRPLTKKTDHGAPVFQTIVHNTLAAFSYRLRAYDARTPWQSEHIHSRPRIKSLLIHCVYPAYVHRANQVIKGGGAVVPTGTRLEVSASFASPCTSAVVQLRLRPAAHPAAHKSRRRSHSHKAIAVRRHPPFTRSLPMKLAGGTLAHVRWTARQSGTFVVHVTDAHGLTNVHPTVHSIEVVPDFPPVARINFPRGTQSATPFAAWPVRFSVSDAYGIKRVCLAYRVQRPTAAEGKNAGAAAGDATGHRFGPAHKIRVPVALGPVGPRVRRLKNAKMVLDFQALHVTPGCRVQYWIQAWNNHQPHAEMGRSRRQRFRIVSPSVLSAALDRRNREVLQALRKVRRRSGKVAGALRRLIGEVKK